MTHQIWPVSSLPIAPENSSLNSSEQSPRAIFNSFLSLVPSPVFSSASGMCPNAPNSLSSSSSWSRTDQCSYSHSLSCLTIQCLSCLSHTLIRTHLWFCNKIQTSDSGWLPLSSMTTSCPLGCLHITDLHHCVPDAGPLSVPLTPFPCFLLLHHHAICSICPQPLGNWLLLCFSAEMGCSLQVSLSFIHHFLPLSFFFISITSCFLLVICFLALLCFFQQISLFLISFLILLWDVGQALFLAMSQAEFADQHKKATS